jgi:hypothetical protein
MRLRRCRPIPNQVIPNQIWNNNQGNGVVHDNMMGDADEANPTTAKLKQTIFTME